MDRDTIHDIFRHACTLVVTTGDYVRSANEALRRATASKENYSDLVTEYDQNTEKMLVADLSAKYPSHKFIGEEATEEGVKCTFTDEPTWIIDPIDGTTNFVHRFPHYGISLGFFVDQKAVFGIVYDVPNDRMYSAIRGEGAFCNGKILKAAPTSVLQEALVATEFGTQRDPDLLKFKFDVMTKLIYKCHGIRSLGCATLNICAVASGQLDSYYEYGPHIWDFAAAHLIAEEAGAVCTLPNGNPLDLKKRKILVACTKELSAQMSGLIEDYELSHD